MDRRIAHNVSSEHRDPGERLAELLRALRNLERGYDRRFAASFKSDEIFELLPALAALVEQLRAELADADADATNAYTIASGTWREEYDKLKQRADRAEAELAWLRYGPRTLVGPPPGGGRTVD